MGKTIFFSTHILADVAEICTQVGIVEAGRLVAQGSLEEMQRRIVPHRRLQVVLLSQAEQAQAALIGREGVIEVRVPENANLKTPAEAQMLEVDFTGNDAEVSGLLKELVSRGFPVLRFTESVHDLEDVFMHATKGIVS
jgi:ABC-2 type transport system ATP-binding protein